MGEGQGLLDEFKTIEEQAQNPTLNEDAQKQATEELRQKERQIMEKQRELQKFRTDTQARLIERRRQHRDLMIDEIKKVVMDVAREKNATLVMDTSDVTGLGVPSVLYADPAWDITDTVLQRLNANRP